jgi:hypothetical protein
VQAEKIAAEKSAVEAKKREDEELNVFHSNSASSSSSSFGGNGNESPALTYLDLSGNEVCEDRRRRHYGPDILN